MKSSMSAASDARSKRVGLFRRWLGTFALLGWGLAAILQPVQAQTTLADRPVFSAVNVPGNLVLALSVEFPTAVTAADRSTSYSTIKKYLGYFDPLKCYTYKVTAAPNGSYFDPDGATDASYGCTGKWSGNFLNWATMQAVDPFRWALTGGYRAVDTATTTILEKAWAPDNQGNTGNNFPHKSMTSGASSATPFSGNFYMRVVRCGNRMLFKRDSAFSGDDCPTTGVTPWNASIATVSAAATSAVFSVEVRVKVCTSAALKEANCTQYGSNYKPEGLIQKYASKIRYSAFGYLIDPPNGGSMMRDGGVLRARMKFVGPMQPVPGSVAVPNVVNGPGIPLAQVTSREWDAGTGVFYDNPDATDATASSVSRSGVINYLNRFGLTAKAYKYYDPVSELYYAATRYLRNLGDVPAYSDLTKYNNGASSPADQTRMKDGFPVITNWADPILYSCQKNFVLGIGDTNSNQDKNLPGNTSYRTNEPSGSPPTDTIDVISSTNKVGVLDGMGASIGATNQFNTSNNSAYMAGMAYEFNTTDIRSDLAGSQTISTYWLDVLEGSDSTNSASSTGYKPGPGGRNQFYLAAKYGGFAVPLGYSYTTNTTALTQSWWSTNGDVLPGLGARPDNYFVANEADKMVSGLESAFSKIAASITAYTTSFSTSLPQVATTGNKSYSSLYDPNNWTGEITASDLSFNATTGNPVLTQKWNLTDRLAIQLASAGWDTGRRIATWNTATNTGVAFRKTDISPAQLGNLDPSYVTGDDSSAFLNYLRGDTTNQQPPPGTVSTNPYRYRAKLLGDIVGSKARPVGPPSFPFSDASNPGYSAFKATWAGRPTVVYFGANDGMLHAVHGDLTASPGAGGDEIFAYIPSALYSGPNGTPNVDGLASLGNPTFTHHFMVNATPNVYDIDFSRTPDDVTKKLPTTLPAPAWRSVLIGGLGKGGKSYYAIDVTDPASMTTESAVAGKVLWEFTDPDLGYTFGDPVVVKTVKYGWVVILPSGYNNATGIGYFFVVNPRTGKLLEKVNTGVGSTTNDAGLAFANAFVVDGSDGTADAVYAGDLLGNLWRWDLTDPTPWPATYPAPLKIASLADSLGVAQPVTSRPVIEVHPTLKKRFVMVGTGRLLDVTDISSTQEQTFYAIADGTNARFNASADLPTGITFPISRTELAANVNVIGTPTTPHVAFDPTTQIGWYEDLGTGSGGIGWRVTTEPTTLAGSVAFATTLPNGNVCSPSGDSRIYGRDFAAGSTTVKTLNTTTNLLEAALFVPITGNVTDLRYLSVGGKATLISGTDTGKLQRIEINPQPNLALRRMNWRELQVVE